MAHLGEFRVCTKNEYKKLTDLTEVTFEDNKTYLLQISNPITFITSATIPKEGGFYIKDSTPMSYTKEEGVDLYVKTDFTPSIVNIAE